MPQKLDLGKLFQSIVAHYEDCSPDRALSTLRTAPS
jgi:hypothetical protein